MVLLLCLKVSFAKYMQLTETDKEKALVQR